MAWADSSPTVPANSKPPSRHCRSGPWSVTNTLLTHRLLWMSWHCVA